MSIALLDLLWNICLCKIARFELTKKAQHAFDALKKAFREANSCLPLSTQALYSRHGCLKRSGGAVLSQKFDGVERPIAFSPRVINSTNATTVPLAVSYWRLFQPSSTNDITCWETKIILRTDNYNLKWLRTFKRLESSLGRWVETLAEFDFEIEHRPGRLHSNVDGVSRPFCKQCLDEVTKTRWVDELDRADGGSTGGHCPRNLRWRNARDSGRGPWRWPSKWLANGQSPPTDLLRQQSP